MKTDPFAIRRRYAKWHPARLLFTANARVQERWARWRFDCYALPPRELADLPPAPFFQEIRNDMPFRQFPGTQTPDIVKTMQ